VYTPVLRLYPTVRQELFFGIVTVVTFIIMVAIVYFLKKKGGYYE